MNDFDVDRLRRQASDAGVEATAWRLPIEGDDPEVDKLVEERDATIRHLRAIVAERDHQAQCHEYGIAEGQWALDHCDECQRLRAVVQATEPFRAP